MMANNSSNTAWRRLNARQKKIYVNKSAEKKTSKIESDGLFNPKYLNHYNKTK
jgi:hypothetical protein